MKAALLIVEIRIPLWSAASTARAQVSPLELIERSRSAVVTVYSRSRNGTSQGSGFFIRSDGLVLTNHHVIKNAVSSEILLRNGTRLGPAKLVYDNADWDLAVLSVATSDVTSYILLADALPRPGERIYVIGSPLGLSPSV